MTWRAGKFAAVILTAALLGLGSGTIQADDLAQFEEDDLVQLDFNDAELTTIIDAISKMTQRNFIYDERVRGKVTIKSPTRITRKQAYAVFESVLQVKGFTTVETPGGALKIIPVRDAKQSNIETAKTSLAPPNTDRFVTRLIPLRYIDADSITNTLKPLVSKDGSIDAYEPTNMVILTEAATNIRRLLAIMEAIDIETYQDELSIFKIEHADASTLAEQVSEIYGAEVSSSRSSRSSSSRRTSRSSASSKTSDRSGSGTAGRNKVRLMTDERTNSVIALAPRAQMQDVRKLIERLDIPVSGSGRIHVYYLQHSDAEELALTLSSLVSGTMPSPSSTASSGQGATSLRAVVQGLAEGVKITADPATNSLVIQSSREGFDTLSEVIAKLDIERPQVLVEALIMEVDITDSEHLGFQGAFRIINGNLDISTEIAPGAAKGFAYGGPIGAMVGGGLPLIQQVLSDSTEGGTEDGTMIQAVLTAAAGDSGTNIISAPHLLTMDNEEAEIRIGQNIPIITGRTQSAQGVSNATGNLATSVNVERQDIGVTLRVTPQITEGDSLRMEIYQEISSINVGLTASGALGAAEDVGVPLSKREIENVVTIRDGETVVIGGLLSDEYQDTVSKVPFLGDIPILGWAFKSSRRELRKINLLVLLTPHIIRTPEHLERETIRKREEFAESSKEGLEWSDRERAAERQRQKAARKAGVEYEPIGDNPVRNAVLQHQARYPEERIAEIELASAIARDEAEAARLAALHAPEFAVQAVVGKDVDEAIHSLQELIDEGYDGTLISNEVGGSVYFDLQIGPFPTIEEAERTSDLVRDVHGLEPFVVVITEEEAEEP
ncbi:MAG: type II secretion system secretin GspD [Deltaproteobacteria bacterium]|nr:type II secretion system secretin GspD [Deltaproteobacteria bacterium]